MRLRKIIAFALAIIDETWSGNDSVIGSMNKNM